MNRTFIWKFLLIAFIVSWAVHSLYPPQSRPLFESFQENIGRRDATYDAIVARYKELAAANPKAEYKNLREAIGTNDITKYFEYDVKAEKDPTGAILNHLQRAAAGKIKLGLDLQGGFAFQLEMQTSALDTNETHEDALKHAVEVLRKRVDKFGVAEPVIQPAGENRIVVQMPGLSEAERSDVREALQRAAFLEFRFLHDESDRLVQEGIVPPGYELMRETRVGRDGQKYTVPHIVSKSRIPGLSGKSLTRSYVTRSTLNEPQIAFSFDGEGAAVFGRVTSENRGRFLAIILDGELYSAPRINEPILGGNGVITGSFSQEEAFNLAAILQNPLEAPLTIISEQSVDPSLGRDTIRSGIQAAIYGTIAVAVFMLVYYLFAGFVANVALLLNIIILLGVFAAFKATLTLPGIAGIVLTVGMAVDANVLIFERIREELAKGKSLRGALAAGYDRAFGTIFDSNITTLIASIILIYMGTGPIKGFGVTLTIGVAVSMFTALFVTRFIFDLLIAKNLLKGLPMLRLIHGTKIDFMRFAKPAFILSWLVIIGGVSYGVLQGERMLGIDFAGGDNVTLSFRQKVDVDKVRAAIRPVASDAVVQYQHDVGTGVERLRITTPYDKGEPAAAALVSALPDAGFAVIGTEKVGPSIGVEILQMAIVAMLLALLGILIYVAFRYEFSFAVGAVVAVIHDVLMVFGVYCLTHLFGEGRQFNANTVAAVLTIIGFSINDTIVIFDRIREDLKLGVRGTFREVINRALNETLSRTVITSGTVFLSTLALFVFGGGAINDFAFTFLAGIIIGTYSTIYIASALVLWWHKGERPRTSATVVMEAQPAVGKA